MDGDAPGDADQHDLRHGRAVRTKNGGYMRIQRAGEETHVYHAGNLKLARKDMASLCVRRQVLGEREADARRKEAWRERRVLLTSVEGRR